MKRARILILLIVVLALAAGGVVGGLRWSRRDLVTVETESVRRADLSAVVTASGEIKPRNYINIGANAQGRITELLVKEGDRVRKNQVVARIEHVQAQADVTAQKAAVASTLADSAAAEAGMKAQDDAIATSAATVDKSRSELDRAKVNLDRYQELWQRKLIAKQDYDQKTADYKSAEAALREDEARLAQMKTQRAQLAAQLASSQRRVTQAQANEQRLTDVLSKFDATAPLDGVVTDLPVRVGETVVPGVQNSAASTIMTIADMSLITAEVRVDETDIVSVQLGQLAKVSIDAMPNRTFTGKVIEIGNTAILRSSGLAASQSATSSQEAKDFKVVVALDDPPEEIRPGLSCSAKITTATELHALTIPLQALTVRKQSDLDTGPDAIRNSPAGKEEIQGVFTVRDGHAEFRKVDTGITGATDIEVLKGLAEGDQIVTGSYKAIRTLRNTARIKIDNRQPAETVN